MSERISIDVDKRLSSSSKTCRRRFGRLYQEGLSCDLGFVTDLSLGMRVLATRVPSGDLTIVLRSRDGDVQLQARVAWSRRKCLGFRHELGLEFLDVDEATARVLTKISSAHRAVESRVA